MQLELLRRQISRGLGCVECDIRKKLDSRSVPADQLLWQLGIDSFEQEGCIQASKLEET
jgi:hypothetical protein